MIFCGLCGGRDGAKLGWTLFCIRARIRAMKRDVLNVLPKAPNVNGGQLERHNEFWGG